MPSRQLPLLARMIMQNMAAQGGAQPSAGGGGNYPSHDQWVQLTGGDKSWTQGWWNARDNATHGGVISNLIEKFFAPSPDAGAPVPTAQPSAPSPAPAPTSTSPAAGTAATPPAAGAPALGPDRIPLSIWKNVYDTGRYTNAPSFFPTLHQGLFPGSRIGPGGSSVANRYVNTGHGTPNSVVTSVPGYAMQAMQINRARNQQ